MLKKPLPDYLFVCFQIILFAGLFFVDDNILANYLNGIPNSIFIILEIIGLVLTIVAILQLNFRISVFPSPTKNTKLITNLAYKYFRHPIYSGLILFFTSFSLATDSVYRLVLITGLFVLFDQKAKYEETLLANTFPDYKNYLTKTWRIIPFVGKLKSVK